jgi:hypothetical protein
MLDKFVGTPDGLADGTFEGPGVSKNLGICAGTTQKDGQVLER